MNETVAVVALFIFALIVLTGTGFVISVLWSDLKEERARVAAVRAELLREHADQIAQLHEFYRASLQAVGNTVQFGTPTPREATMDLEPTPEQSLGRAVEEDTIARGMETLRREYAAAGITITEEELRTEVLSIVTGQPIPEPASIRGLIDRAPIVPVN